MKSVTIQPCISQGRPCTYQKQGCILLHFYTQLLFYLHQFLLQCWKVRSIYNQRLWWRSIHHVWHRRGPSRIWPDRNKWRQSPSKALPLARHGEAWLLMGEGWDREGGGWRLEFNIIFLIFLERDEVKLQDRHLQVTLDGTLEWIYYSSYLKNTLNGLFLR